MFPTPEQVKQIADQRHREDIDAAAESRLTKAQQPARRARRAATPSVPRPRPATA